MAKKAKGRIEIVSEECKDCRLCIHFCPQECIGTSTELNSKGHSFAVFRADGQCTGCAQCATVCPEAIIEVYRA